MKSKLKEGKIFKEKPKPKAQNYYSNILEEIRSSVSLEFIVGSGEGQRGSCRQCWTR
jgi:hypothetical protein